MRAAGRSVGGGSHGAGLRERERWRRDTAAGWYDRVRVRLMVLVVHIVGSG